MIDPRTVRALATLFESLTVLHQEMVLAIAQERSSLERFSIENIQEATALREQIAVSITDATTRLAETRKEFPDGEGRRLSQLIREHAALEQQTVLLPRLKKLAEAARSSHRAQSELSQVLDHSNTMVGGLISILLSGNRHVTRGYSRKGQIKESSHPVNSNSALKRA